MVVTQKFRVIARVEVIRDAWLEYDGVEPKQDSEIVRALRFGDREDMSMDWGGWEQIGDYHQIIMISDPERGDEVIWEQGITLDQDSVRNDLIEMLNELVWHREQDMLSIEKSSYPNPTENEEIAEHQNRINEIEAMIGLLCPRVAEEAGNHGPTQ